MTAFALSTNGSNEIDEYPIFILQIGTKILITPPGGGFPACAGLDLRFRDMRDLIFFLVAMNVAIAAAAFSEAGDFTSFAHYPIAGVLSSAVTVLLLRFKVIALA